MTIPELRRRHLPPPGPVLDFHVHVCSGLGPHGRTKPEDDARLLLAAADRAGVTHLLLNSLGPACAANPTPKQLQQANDLTLTAVEQAPGRLQGLCYVSGEHPRASHAEILRCLENQRLVGLKLWIACRASDPRVVDLVAHAAALGVPVLQHAWDKVSGNLPGESTPDDVARLARAVPDAKIVMAHLYGHGMRGVERVEACTNVFIDLSGGDPEAGLLDYACARLGYRRLIFGSDAPVRGFGVTLGKVIDSGLTAPQQRAVLWDNGARLLPSWAFAAELERLR